MEYVLIHENNIKPYVTKKLPLLHIIFTHNVHSTKIIIKNINFIYINDAFIILIII